MKSFGLSETSLLLPQDSSQVYTEHESADTLFQNSQNLSQVFSGLEIPAEADDPVFHAAGK